MDSSTEQLIRAAIAEDVGNGDVTATYFVPEESVSKARIAAREPGVVAGMEVALRVFQEIEPRIEAKVVLKDGSPFEAGDVLLELSGPSRGILTGERTALNFLQRLSGVATQARRYVEAVKPHPVQIWDTRKTTPGWRLLEKAAVKAGGGTNHRMGLYDHVMVKDNHLAANGGLEELQAAIDRVKQDRPDTRIQLEADNLEQVAGFLTLRGVDMLLLDNMGPVKLREAVEMNGGRLWLEASGGITLETIRDVAATGVNAISVGALTHSARALDLGLDFL
ncbi:nicotinate-nucleotide pyrophosphorylase [carboxylating] [Prosthecobacter fusiformis]|uniref:Probable nicotinate-nucleotide pyrophosphorylase [carboxylating] n=1 Tax=Prosthecobacter fusiformis TaxID=48464 RepID=A0A4R7RY25_9BACT|nr:carboxylating nicotinate-nucleotide diphosphorylase [Prosthecobacter fusiformis]TDU70810.1 nicotinate-nucleotide pyrophosphorylase [carboxylating] [Prosthecobacter fusiformis]